VVIIKKSNIVILTRRTIMNDVVLVNVTYQIGRLDNGFHVTNITGK